MALRRSALVAATVGGIVLLLLVVALSARGWPRTGVDPVRIDPAVMSEYLVPLLRWLYLMALAFAFYHWLVSRDLGERRAAPGRRRVSPVATLLALVLVATVALILVDLADTLEGMTLLPSQPAGIASGDPATRPAPPETVTTNRSLGLALVAALLALAVAGWRRGGEAEEEHPRPAARVVVPPDAPSPSFPTDPRGRVFAAYRAVEARSGRAGWERRPAETVTRHLARLPVDHADTRRLAAIYNTARFSDHPVRSATADEAEEAAARIERALP